MSRSKHALRSFATLLGALLVQACAPALSTVVEPAPDFELPRLGGGDPVRLSALRGKPVVVDFWATWCEPCKRSMPEHARLAARHEGRLALLAVNVDEDAQAVARFVERRGLKVPVLLDPRGRTPEAFGVTAMPYAIVIDAEGRVVERIAGEPYPRLAEVVDRLLVRP